MRGNGAYDPDFDLGGTSPAWYPLYAAMYQNYVCTGSKITAMWHMHNTVTDFPPIKLFVVASRNTALEYALDKEIYDEPYHKMIHVNLSTPQKYWKIQMYMSTRKQFKGFSIGDNNFVALTSATPAFQWYWLAGCSTQGVDPAIGACIVTLDLKIKYYIKFSDPKQNDEYERPDVDFPYLKVAGPSKSVSVQLIPNTSTVVEPVIANKV